MITYSLFLSLYARLLSDTGVNGLYDSTAPYPALYGIYDSYAPPNIDYPFIVINIEESPDDAFQANLIVATVRVSIYSSTQPTDSASAALSNIEARVYGDSAGQSNFIPSFGFHRYVPVVTQGSSVEIGWVGTGMIYEGTTILDDAPDYLLRVMQFKVYLYQTAVSY